MQDYIFPYIHSILTVFGILVFLFAVKNRANQSVLRTLVGVQFFFVVIHTWEELKFPGGFTEMMQETIGFTLANQNFGELVLAIAIILLFIPALIFPKKGFLLMIPMLLGLLEVIGHTAAIWMFNRPVPYTPGLATAALLMFPLSVYGIRYGIKNNLVKPTDFVFSIMSMFAILMISQMIVVESSGMNYLDFLQNIKSTL